MGLFAKADRPTPLDGVDAVFADLDGVVYAGAGALPHAVDALNRVAASMPVAYITNNASRSDATVAAHLVELGLTTVPTDVVTSPQAAMQLLAGVAAPGALVLVIGGEGIVVELEKAGYRVTRSADDLPDAVVQGFAQDVGWLQLAEASFALQAERENGPVPWIATNQDWTIPVARGIAPGNGTLVSAVHTAVGRLPLVAGKPETPIFDVAAERFAAAAPLMIGDRLDTDILGARRAGWRSLHVLTGIDTAKQLLAAVPTMRPDFIVEDLRGLFEPYPEVVHRGDEVRVGKARVRLDGIAVQVVADGAPIDLLRAACALIWESGRTVHQLQVPERLYS
ncbi:HAD-IIA family hydrolase [Agromyces seonyuensis]|uniref:HAD-IIA family hydrolase n=1 Tax=Agromyces seonyuensis TaxID=2662446 RepID=A0A6I4P0J2_9MICO|nr:HAD-IIA family hydrolase [Agromyces seonyuensis]